jgi:hypothetical protein
LLLADAHESLDGRAAAFGTEAWKCLGIFPLADGGLRQEFSGCDGALPSPPMDTDGN